MPVFVADVKGDLSGLRQAGSAKPGLLKRAAQTGPDDYAARAFPVVLWDLYGRKGHPIRTTVSEMGPLLLSCLLGLNDTQEGVLNVVFAVADDEGMLLLDLKDLSALLTYVAEKAATFAIKYGNVNKASVGAIMRRLLVLQREGGENLSGEPALDINDFMRCDEEGFGYVNILAADKLMQSPRLYSMFLLWLMAELFEELPEAGDQDKLKLVFFLRRGPFAVRRRTCCTPAES